MEFNKLNAAFDTHSKTNRIEPNNENARTTLLHRSKRLERAICSSNRNPKPERKSFGGGMSCNILIIITIA